MLRGTHLKLSRSIAFTIVLCLSVLFQTQASHANQARSFIRACTFGVLTGALVGTAMLAFEDQPGENLQQIARGASLGLYVGIGLGLWVMYGNPGGSSEPSNDELLNAIGDGASLEPPPVYLVPLISENRIEGAMALYNLATF